MKIRKIFVRLAILFIALPVVHSQDKPGNGMNIENYINELMQPEEDYLTLAEEWRGAVDGLIDRPVGINSPDIEILQVLHLISRLQLNKLKEYRLIYGNLISVHELNFVESWDEKTISQVLPLISLSDSPSIGSLKKIRLKSVQQQLILKTSFIMEKRKGYKNNALDDNEITGPVYLGSPLKMSLRYDLDLRKRIKLGLRMEKDPGEPYLVPSRLPATGLKNPDHLSGFVQVNHLGPFHYLIIGDYQVSFGYGVNFSAGQYGSLDRSGPVTMAHRIRGQTSLSETGFLRGASALLRIKRLDLCVFSSWQKHDGSSLVSDEATSKVISFSSINETGLHRTQSELDNRKTINERVLGGMLVYGNNWLKAGIIAFQNQYDALAQRNPRPYSTFHFTGNSNFVIGASGIVWLKNTQLFTEGSVSRNKGWAGVAGIRFSPSPGGTIGLISRNFSKDYHNWHGMGYISRSRNNNERGLQASISLELPGNIKLVTMADYSISPWFRFNLNFPTRQLTFLGLLEKSWRNEKSVAFTAKYYRRTIKDAGKFDFISKPSQSGQWRLRMEARYVLLAGVSMKSRIESNLSIPGGARINPGWLLFHDISYSAGKQKLKIWFRICFFQVDNYEDRIYAYENDVLYDFTSFMFYGKGSRGILMISWGPLKWLDLWARASTIRYTNRTIGTGWDAIDGSRMNELEFQVRIRYPD